MLSALNQNLAVTGKDTDIYCIVKFTERKEWLKWNICVLSTVQEDEIEVDEFPIDPDVSCKVF